MLNTFPLNITGSNGAAIWGTRGQQTCRHCNQVSMSLKRTADSKGRMVLSYWIGLKTTEDCKLIPCSPVRWSPACSQASLGPSSVHLQSYATSQGWMPSYAFMHHVTCCQCLHFYMSLQDLRNARCWLIGMQLCLIKTSPWWDAWSSTNNLPGQKPSLVWQCFALSLGSLWEVHDREPDLNYLVCQ